MSKTNVLTSETILDDNKFQGVPATEVSRRNEAWGIIGSDSEKENKKSKSSNTDMTSFWKRKQTVGKSECCGSATFFRE